MMRCLSNCALLAWLLAAALALAGCPRDRQDLLLRTTQTAVPGGEALGVGLGWSAEADPAGAASQAVQSALESLPRRQSPHLVLVWENWPARADSEKILDTVARQVPRETIYGGNVAWPVTSRWTTRPSVTVLAFYGGWGAKMATVGQVGLRQQDVAELLADGLGLPPARPPVWVAPTTQPAAATAAPAGGDQLVVLFGEIDGLRAEQLADSLTTRLGGGIRLIGGSGAGVDGSGYQFAAGQIVRNAIWAVRLEGRMRARAVAAPAEPDAGAIGETLSLQANLLADELPGSPPWRLVLAIPSAGWLATVNQPDELVRTLSAPLRPRDGRLLVAGWAAPTQIGPGGELRSLASYAFGVAAAAVEPIAPTTQPQR